MKELKEKITKILERSMRGEEAIALATEELLKLLSQKEVKGNWEKEFNREFDYMIPNKSLLKAHTSRIVGIVKGMKVNEAYKYYKEITSFLRGFDRCLDDILKAIRK